MDTIRLKASLSGADPETIARQVLKLPAFAGDAPWEVRVDNSNIPVSSGWLDRAFREAKAELYVIWDENLSRWVQYTPGVIVKFANPGVPRDPEAAWSLIGGLPFELASFASIYEDWSKEDGEHYLSPGFGGMHFPLGWGCAFKGKGHDRLVSRRWLDYGPWRLVRGPDETSLVQFHDLRAGPATALAQARPGHDRMGITDTGGFLQDPYFPTHRIKGLYDSAECQLKVFVHGRHVTQLEMLDACAVRHYQGLGPSQPLKSVAYVFAEEQRAREHLHELWLRDLQCWTFINALEKRIDTDYHPVPNTPEWVRTLGGSGCRGESAAGGTGRRAGGTGRR